MFAFISIIEQRVDGCNKLLILFETFVRIGGERKIG